MLFRLPDSGVSKILSYEWFLNNDCFLLSSARRRSQQLEKNMTCISKKVCSSWQLETQRETEKKTRANSARSCERNKLKCWAVYDKECILRAAKETTLRIAHIISLKSL